MVSQFSRRSIPSRGAGDVNMCPGCPEIKWHHGSVRLVSLGTTPPRDSWILKLSQKTYCYQGQCMLTLVQDFVTGAWGGRSGARSRRSQIVMGCVDRVQGYVWRVYLLGEARTMKSIIIELSDDEYADLEAAAQMWHWGKTAADAARQAVKSELGAYRWEVRKKADPEGAKAVRERAVSEFLRGGNINGQAFRLGAGTQALLDIDEAINCGYSAMRP